MSPQRLTILYVSQMPASPPRFGAQARMHGLMTQLAGHHDLTAVMLVDDEFDIEECRRAMQAYCGDVVLVPNPYGCDGLSKRLLQLRSLASTRSFERLRVTVLCSSFSVYDYSSTRRTLDEDSPLHNVRDVYARDGYTISKWWQERVTRRYVEKHGWDLTVLRPGFIWGRDHGYLAALGQQFGRHTWSSAR